MRNSCWFDRVSHKKENGPVQWAKDVIEMQKGRLTEWSCCCFKMYENCMEQRILQVAGPMRSFSFAWEPQSTSPHAVTCNTGTRHFKHIKDIKCNFDSPLQEELIQEKGLQLFSLVGCVWLVEHHS